MLQSILAESQRKFPVENAMKYSPNTMKIRRYLVRVGPGAVASDEHRDCLAAMAACAAMSPSGFQLLRASQGGRDLQITIVTDFGERDIDPSGRWT